MAPKKRKHPVPRAKARTQRVIEREVLTELKPPYAKVEGETCGACLLPVEAKEKVGLIDSCAHIFHYDCVSRWASTENSCPQCKLRFFWMASYSAQGRRESLHKVEKKDQEEAEDDDQFEDVQVCEKCKQVGDETTLLLCDGMHGTCNAAFHYTCVGLSEVPRGSWFCPDCEERGFDMDARGRRRCSNRQPAASASNAPGVAGEAGALDLALGMQAEPVGQAEPAGEAATPAEANRRRRGRGGPAPAHLRLNNLACLTSPVELPTFRSGGGGGPAAASSSGTGAGGGGRSGIGSGSQATGLFASFVQRRKAQRGEAASTDAGSGGGFISLNPTYEDDFMGQK